ncbi:protein phosphatase 2C domain-containing protein, partial [Toxoplasma gondii GT1]
PFPVIRGIGWSEDQGRRPDMEDGMVAISNLAGVANAWLLGIYDGHGGRQTVEMLLQKIHGNVLQHLRSRAIERWQRYRQRAMSRLQDIRRRLDELHFQQQLACRDVRVLMPPTQRLVELLRLGRICEWVLQCEEPSQEGRTETEKSSASKAPTPPSFLTICTEEDVHRALDEAFVQTDVEILRDRVYQSGATACVCLVRPVLRLDLLLEMRPEEISDADWAWFSVERQKPNVIPASTPSQHAIVQADITVAHLGDSRAVLAYTDGHAERLTHPSDHKAGCEREVRRVESLGGWVFGERVNGMLAIGRAFGDWSLKLPPGKANPPYSPTSGAFDRLLNIFGTSPSHAAEQAAAERKEYVVSNAPDVRSVSLTPERPAQVPGGIRRNSPSSRASESQTAMSGQETGAGRVPGLLVLGCDGLFDVCSDQVVAHLALEFLRQLVAVHPDMSPCEAAKATARMLIEEAIGVRGSTDNVSVMVALFHSFGFSGRDGVTPSPQACNPPSVVQFSSLSDGVPCPVFVGRDQLGCPAEAVARDALAAATPRNARCFSGGTSFGQFDGGHDYAARVAPPGLDAGSWAERWLPKGLAEGLQEASHRLAAVMQH